MISFGERTEGLSEVKCGLNHPQKKGPDFLSLQLGGVSLCLSVHVLLFSLCQHVMQTVLMCGCINSFVCCKAVTRSFLTSVEKNVFIYTKRETIQCQQEQSVWWRNTLDTCIV